MSRKPILHPVYEGTVGFTWLLMKEPQEERPLLVDVEDFFFFVKNI
jgi:hypothetical protein